MTGSRPPPIKGAAATSARQYQGWATWIFGKLPHEKVHESIEYWGSTLQRTVLADKPNGGSP